MFFAFVLFNALPEASYSVLIARLQRRVKQNKSDRSAFASNHVFIVEFYSGMFETKPNSAKLLAEQAR
jgi:hypothetical protein